MSDSDEQTEEERALRERLLTDASALVAYLRKRLPQSADASASLPASISRARAAAVLAPLYALSGHPYLLFTRRTTQLRKHSGEVSLPGGSRDPGDDSLLMTALRESYEELALDLTRI